MTMVFSMLFTGLRHCAMRRNLLSGDFFFNQPFFPLAKYLNLVECLNRQNVRPYAQLYVCFQLKLLRIIFSL